MGAISNLSISVLWGAPTHSRCLQLTVDSFVGSKKCAQSTEHSFLGSKNLGSIGTDGRWQFCREQVLGLMEIV